MCRGASPSGSQGGRSSGIGAIRALAELARMRGERGGVGSELGDLERDRGSALQLLLELVITALPVRAVSVTRGAKSRQGFLPCLGVDLREAGRAVLKSERLRGDAGRLVPGVMRATRDHRDQPGGEAHRERRGRAAPGGLPARRQLREEVVEPQVEVVVVSQSRTSVRPCVQGS